MTHRTDNFIKNHFYSTIRRSLRRINKELGDKNSTEQVKNIKPGVLSKIFTFANTDPNTVQDDPGALRMIAISKYLDECLVKYSNYKPSKKNKQKFIEGNEEAFKNFIHKILEFNDGYKKQKKQKKGDGKKRKGPSAEADSSGESDDEDEGEEDSEEQVVAKGRPDPKKVESSQTPGQRGQRDRNARAPAITTKPLPAKKRGAALVVSPVPTNRRGKSTLAQAATSAKNRNAQLKQVSKAPELPTLTVGSAKYPNNNRSSKIDCLNKLYQNNLMKKKRMKPLPLHLGPNAGVKFEGNENWDQQMKLEELPSEDSAQKNEGIEVDQHEVIIPLNEHDDDENSGSQSLRPGARKNLRISIPTVTKHKPMNDPFFPESTKGKDSGYGMPSMMGGLESDERYLRESVYTPMLSRRAGMFGMAFSPSAGAGVDFASRRFPSMLTPREDLHFQDGLSGLGFGIPTTPGGSTMDHKMDYYPDFLGKRASHETLGFPREHSMYPPISPLGRQKTSFKPEEPATPRPQLNIKLIDSTYQYQSRVDGLWEQGGSQMLEQPSSTRQLLRSNTLETPAHHDEEEIPPDFELKEE